MEIQFDDIVDEFMFKECLAHCYYDDPKCPEYSKLMNQYIDELREKYITTIKPLDTGKFKEMYTEFTKRFPEIQEFLNGT